MSMLSIKEVDSLGLLLQQIINRYLRRGNFVRRRVPLRQKTRLFSAGVRALAFLVIAFSMHFFVVLLRIITVVMID